jgi:hypothetical protein
MIEIKKSGSTNLINYKRLIFTNLTNLELVNNSIVLLDPIINKFICPIQIVVSYFSYTDNIDYKIICYDSLSYGGGGSDIILLYNGIAADQTGTVNILPIYEIPGLNTNVSKNSPLILKGINVSGGLPTTVLNLDLTIDIYYTLND